MRLWIIETTIRVNSPRLCQLQPQEAFDVNKQGDEEKIEEGTLVTLDFVKKMKKKFQDNMQSIFQTITKK
jgi:hypothetical protein